MTTYALNGLGRIGKLALRPLLEAGANIAWINDAVGDPAMHAHLLEFDTVHGRWDAAFAHDETSVTVDGTRLPFIGTRDLTALPLDGVDVVIDCTGAFKTEAKLAPYFAAGVQKVVVSAPVKDGPTANIVYGVNDESMTPRPTRSSPRPVAPRTASPRWSRLCTRALASSMAPSPRSMMSQILKPSWIGRPRICVARGRR